MTHLTRTFVSSRWVAAATLAGALGLATACGDAATTGEGADPGAQSGPGAAATADAPEKDALLAAYDRGLDFLAQGQTDGKWQVQEQANVGYTAMCLTNFLERPGGPREADRAMIEKGLAFIAKAIGDDGSVKEAYRPNYETSVVIMALAASGDDGYRGTIDEAAQFIYKLQRLEEDNPTWGGIGYGSDNTRSDLSNTQYALASLRAAGIPEDDPVFQRALTFLQRTQNRKENETEGEPTEWTDKETGKKLVRSNDGGANYFPGNSKAGFDERPDGVGELRSYGSMTYALLRCYAFAGLGLEDGRVKAAVDWLAENWTLDHNPGMSGKDRNSGTYYMYATMGKALSLAGVDALEVPETGSVDWRKELSGHLLAAQREDGSWINEQSERWMEGDPVLATSYALNALATTIR
jgi:squalene-hopene/tetraprenyl-beta-curcumene cyclase